MSKQHFKPLELRKKTISEGYIRMAVTLGAKSLKYEHRVIMENIIFALKSVEQHIIIISTGSSRLSRQE